MAGDNDPQLIQSCSLDSAPRSPQRRAPVVLFNSFCGSQLECVSSPRQDWGNNKLLVMNTQALLAGFREDDLGLRTADNLRDSTFTAHQVNNVFLEHVMLDSATNGDDVEIDGEPIQVRPRTGLAAIEYLTDSKLLRNTARLLIGLTTALRNKGYFEWDGAQGDMLAASYDWRLMPAEMEKRDRFMSKLIEQIEALVAAAGTPAVIIAHSYGCKVSKWFLHFCLVCKGAQWLDEHIDHFVPLGGPFAGSVEILRNTVADGHTGEALDNLYSDSELLAICRSWPAMRHLQPTGRYNDGLSLPFIYLRHELYLHVNIGRIVGETAKGLLQNQTETVISVAGNVTKKRQSWKFSEDDPFVEQITFVLTPNTTEAYLQVSIGGLAGGKYHIVLDTMREQTGDGSVKVPLTDCKTNLSVGGLCLKLGLTDSLDLCSEPVLKPPAEEEEHASGWLQGQPQPGLHPQLDSDHQRTWRVNHDELLHPHQEHHAYCHHLMKESQHEGALTDRPSGLAKLAQIYSWGGCGTEALEWVPACQLQLQDYIGLLQHPADSFRVPGPDGTAVDMCAPPPVKKITAFYGVNLPTVRTIFLRHRPVFHQGGQQECIESPFMFDEIGNADGVRTLSGIGYEMNEVQQVRPDSNEAFYRSGDGTVPYQSLRSVGAWHSSSCDVSIFELPGCGHREITEDERMLWRLYRILGCDRPDAESPDPDQTNEQLNPNAGVYGSSLFEVVAKFGCKCTAQRLLLVKFGLWYQAVVFLVGFGCVGCCALTAAIALVNDYNWNQELAWANSGVVYNLTHMKSQYPNSSDDYGSYSWYYNATFGIDVHDATAMDSDIWVGLYRVAWQINLYINDTAYTSECIIRHDQCSSGIYSEAPCFTTRESAEACTACLTSSIVVNILSIIATVFVFWAFKLGQQRMNPLLDTRAHKVLHVGVALVGCTLQILVVLAWSNVCLDAISPQMADEAATIESWTAPTWQKSTMMVVLLPTMVLLAIAVLGIFSPVPESFFSTWLKKNSLASHHLEVAMSLSPMTRGRQPGSDARIASEHNGHSDRHSDLPGSGVSSSDCVILDLETHQEYMHEEPDCELHEAQSRCCYHNHEQ